MLKITERLLEEYSAAAPDSCPSGRVRFLKDLVYDNMSAANCLFGEMGSVLNEETNRLPVIIRKAMAEKQKLARVPVGIWEKQIFAGCFTLNDTHTTISYDLPAYAHEEERLEGEKYGFGIYSMFGHIAPNHPRLLELGICGLREMIDRRLAGPVSEKTAAFLRAALISLAGLELFAHRHGAVLLEQADKAADPRRRAELRRAAEALLACPGRPARNFFEACQAMWLTHLALQLTDNYLALGRVDQFLEPYLRQDLEAGVLNLEEAQEMVDCLMLKFNERSQDNELAARMMDLERLQKLNDQKWSERKLYDIGHQRYNIRDTVDAVNHWNQNIIIGGVRPENGADATNLMTVMMLEAFRRLRMTNPVLSIRIHSKTPDYLLRQTAITLKTGGGLPALYNDDVIIPSYEKFGFAAQEARDYANNGCWEVILPGRTDFYFIKLNALKCLEWALNHGKCHVDGLKEVPDQGDVADIKSFEMLYVRVMENFRIVMEEAAAHMVETQHLRAIVAPMPLLSALLDGPIEKGLDMSEMGARDIVGGTIAEGLSHLIDSLCAVDQVVFREGYCSIREVAAAVDHNFEGFEELQTRLASCPKYGANEPAADEIGRRVTMDYAMLMQEIDRKYPQMKFMPGIGTFSWYIAIGEGTGASPDGRRLGEPVASNFSPSAGAMSRGIVGALESFCNMCLDVMPLGSPLDLGISGRYLEGEEGTVRLMGLLRTFVQMKGNLLTISVADADLLRSAQKNPARFRDLRVRMGGWSAYFTMLSPEQQEYHIRKSETGFF